MAKKQQPTTAASKSKDDEPVTPSSKNDQPLITAKKNDPPPPSKKPEEEKVEEKDGDDSSSEESSSSECEEDGESEDEESGEEEQPPSPQPASKTAQTEKSESDEEETDTDSDQEPSPKKPQPKSSAAPSISGTKRCVENDETKQSKKKKKTTAADDKQEQEDNKKPDDEKKLFQRVFNEDDELAILKGLVDFTVNTGTDPVKNFRAFYEDVKKLIHFPVTIDQLKDKVRRLKSKFEKKLKSCKNGKTPSFSKPIEKKMFEFSKTFWAGNVVDENGKKKLEMEPDSSKETRKESVSNVFGSGMDLLNRGAKLLDEPERIELEKKWMELKIAELKLFKMRAELAEEQTRLILDALMSSSSD